MTVEFGASMPVITTDNPYAGDLMVVNAARVSMNKHRTKLGLKDIGIIEFMATHNHWTPFGHPQIQLYFEIEMFSANQLKRHTVGLVINEESRRYVQYTPTIKAVEQLRGKPEDGYTKQGSGADLPADKNARLLKLIEEHNQRSLDLYELLDQEGVCAEQSRMVLPQATIVKFYETGSLAAWSRICNLRKDPEAQKEIRDIAAEIDAIIAPMFPVSWAALQGNTDKIETIRKQLTADLDARKAAKDKPVTPPADTQVKILCKDKTGKDYEFDGTEKDLNRQLTSLSMTGFNSFQLLNVTDPDQPVIFDGQYRMVTVNSDDRVEITEPKQVTPDAV